jgi:serine/threonine-protein kinase
MRKILTIIFIIGTGFLILGLTTWFSLLSGVNGETVKVPDFQGMSVTEAIKKAKQNGIFIKINTKRKVFSEFIKKNHVAAQDPMAGKTIKKNREIEIILSKGSKAETIPNLIGKSLEQASYEISRKNLRLTDIAYIYSNNPEGVIVAQSPKPNNSGLADNRIKLVVSKGKKQRQFIMPDLRMLPLTEVEKKLNTMGIKYIVKTFANQIEDKNTLFVKEQFPAPGFLFNKKDIITLRVEERERL